MFQSPAFDWLLGVFAVAGVLWTLVKSVRIRVNVKVRKLAPGEAPPASTDEPKVSVQMHTNFAGKPIHFGTRTGLPARGADAHHGRLDAAPEEWRRP